MKPKTRRRFLKQTAVATGLASLTPYFPWSQSAFANQSKNDRPVIGGIGLGGMGSGDCRGHAKFGDIVAVADVDENHAQRARNDERIGKGKADVVADYRRILDRDDIDVVSIATPDHWHVKIAIEALQAGKHVFCQKPLTLTLEENQLIRAACTKYADRVFMVGTQQRSERSKFLRAVNMVQKGLLGDIKHIKIGINGGSVGKHFTKSTPPANLDWDAWLGQAPKVAYIKERCHGTFRWWYEYSGGKFTDWGAHHVDIATWAIDQQGKGQGPVSIDGADAKHPVEFKDGYPTSDDTFNTAHDYNIVCKYANGIQMDIESRGDNGILFTGTKGRVFVNRSKIVGTPIEENWDKDSFDDSDLQRLFKGKVVEGHKGNFYRCIREGGLPVSDVFTHTQAMSVCHLAAIAARLGRKIKWDPKAETIVGDEVAAALIAREQRAGYEIPRVS
ncbi:Gfo/Idh/MocA family protein [Planctomycetes bacterium K23_9]|uniref:Inositol 2-dehydrogenase n=1 Tax=Stieleria marina TaxID=1930275 RepID=A0A517NVR6_9BACT|nr:Inositol 2-dehydrogenase [Planctomycetes bacterium K23_9]